MRVESTDDRIVEIDLLRGFAISAVVGLHVAWTYTLPAELGSPGGRVVALMALLNGFGVPLFLALSAAGLSLRHSRSISLAGHLDFLRRRVTKLLPAYLFWSFVSALLFRPDAFGSVNKIAAVFVRGNADGQFYFVPLLVEFYVLWPLLRPLASVSARSAPLALAVAAGGMAVSVLWWRIVATGAHSTSALQPLFWIGYVAVGIAAASRLADVRRAARSNPLLVACAVATIFAAAGMFSSFLALVAPAYDPAAVTWAAVIFQIPPALYTLSVMTLLTLLCCRWRNGVLVWPANAVGSRAYGIFLVHLVVLRLVILPLVPKPTLAGASAAHAAAQVLACWAVCLLLSGALVEVMSRSRRTRMLVSNRW